MQQHYQFDAIVIGSGLVVKVPPWGLVKQGARVAVIERYNNVGGGCTHWGTIPSKALLPRRQPHYRIQPEPALQQLAHAQRDLP